MKSATFSYPTTRYSGSKRRLLDFLREHVKEIRFKSVLDVFGGTASVSLMLKRENKRVHYNDLLRFNTLIGQALVENRRTTVSTSEIDAVVGISKDSPDLISRHFQGAYYLDHENQWLDSVVYKITKVTDPYKNALLMAALFQACLAKRPFNLFHRVNLYIRTREVSRSFGNKTTWERPFEELFRRYIAEYNAAVMDNGKANRVVGGYDAFECPNGVDLVYLDPPYYAEHRTQGTNYLEFYHFLERLAHYEDWMSKPNSAGDGIPPDYHSPSIDSWAKRINIYRSFMQIIERFQDNIIVLSYRDHGVPDQETIRLLLRLFKKRVTMYSMPTKYVLSNVPSRELLFIAR
jgi:adenine-specific DNA-methyltransferase